ncbi:hypothetical protein [Rubrivirga sp.]|uniref:hypothetical protein n=1 Tax=Rubrivirga sp. TaxID=1885344 RepID=UPI003B517E47
MRPLLSLVATLALVAICLASAASAQAPPATGPVTGPPATQEVSFVEGPNLVSLRVYPDDPSLDAIFHANADDIVLIKDSRGAVFAPSYGIENLTAWEWGQSLLVQARGAFTITVSGALIAPEAPVELEAGWNWIPYFLEAPAEVEDALVSLEGALERVEDGSGRAYPTTSGGPALTTLDPGRGYKVRLSEASTLLYPSAAPSPSMEVATIAEAIALTGLAPGQEVTVRGFRAEDDGGQGVLRVTESGCVPDGGTCFVPTEHTQAGEPYATAFNVTLYGSSIQWESFRLCHSTAGAPTDPTTTSGDGCYDAFQLHGHGGEKAGEKIFDPANGRVEINSPMRSFARKYDGNNSFDHTIEYRFSTSDLRLERIIEPVTLEQQTTTAYVRPEWWGARPDGDDATDAISWALESAETKAVATDTEHYVVLRGMYHYAGVIETQERTVLKGEQDGVRDGQGLRVKEGAPWHYWAVRDETDDAFSSPLSERDVLGSPMVVLRHGRKSVSDRIVDVEIDGNLEENDYVFDNQYRSAAGISTYEGFSMVDELLQNTAHWNGFVASHNTRDVPLESNSALINTHIHDFGGNILLSSDRCHFGNSKDILLGNSARNHIMYGVPTGPGTFINGIEIYGFSWKAPVEQYQGHYKNVVFRDIVTNPYPRLDPEILGLLEHRNTAPDPSVFFTPNEAHHFFGEDILIEGVTIDLRNASDNAIPTRNLIGYHRGPKIVRDVTVLLGEPGESNRYVTLVNSRGNSATPTSSFVLENAQIQGGGVSQINTSYAGNVRVTGLSVPDNTGGNEWGAVYQVRTQSPDGVFVFQAEGQQRAKRPLGIWMSEPGAGADVFLSDMDFINVDYPLKVEHFSMDAAARYRVFWRDVSFDRWRYGSSALKDIQYLQGVTNSSNGRTSEDEGALTSAPLSNGPNGRYVDVPVNLLWEPLDASYVTVGGASASRFTGWTNVGDEDKPVLRLTFSGTSSVSITWQAAVRPIPSDVVFPD